jgi:hypothetical protein
MLKTIANKMFSAETGTTSDDAWARARALVRRGPPFVPSEAADLAAAFEGAHDRPMLDGLDVLTIQVCSRFPRPAGPAGPAAPPGPTPLDARIAEAEAELEAVQVREEAARSHWQQLTDRARAAVLRPVEWEARMADVEAALEDHRAVDQEWLRVRARLMALCDSRDRWRRDQDA